MMIVIILGCIFATALAAPQNFYRPQQPQNQQSYSNKPIIPIVSESNELNPDGSFSYSYVSGDGSQAQAQGYLKNQGQKDAEAEVIQGSYSYTAPDGTPITVNWIADENGFRAEGSHIPTPPPIPAEIQKSLVQISQGQGAQPQGQYRPNPFQGQGGFSRPSRPSYRF
ncbi:endocuticle structural glycoprotein SgAbd-2-like [Sitophilus oryzae]|uniref:Endocuticle structural glycoprotein SgAbd-2-like n=1 Tax=Sitophilus oryzae TaxID=7048 RepID=A0A6J2X9M0_SITOR|nr:endocuticle structural glycoprotein SgAbd-2-like [Sitophilus oryzae]